MRYIIYVRKSTEREDRQVLSIQSQIIEMKEIAERENLNVIEILQESKSAKDPGRPIFNSMVEKFKKGEADGILCWKIDRLARNPVDEGIIKWYLQKNIIKQIKTFDRDYDPEDNVVIASIEFSMANQYIRDLSKNVKRGIAQKIRRGEYPASPPIGYLIDDKTKRLLIDKKKWQYIKNAFKLYATGLFSIKQLESKLYKDGFRSPTGNLFYAGSLHRMLKNPIYYGWFAWRGQIYKGVHPPIISKSLFDQAQEILFPRKHLKRDNKLDFTFRGFMICGECGLKITAENKKGHTYYRCTKSRGVNNCSQKYIREEDLIEEIDERLARLRFDDEIMDLIVKATKEASVKDLDYQAEAQKKNNSLLDKNKSFQNSLVEKFIDNKIPEEIYNKKLAESKNKEAELEGIIKNLKENYKNVFEKIELVARFTKLAKHIFKKGNADIKKEVVSIISSNIEIKDKKIAKFVLDEPFCWLMEDIDQIEKPKRKKRVFEPSVLPSSKTKTAPCGTAFSTVSGRRDSNPESLGPKPSALAVTLRPVLAS